MGDPSRHISGHILAEETAIAISFNGTTQAVMMASPQDVEDFAYGFALSEGFVANVGEVERIEVAEHPTGLEAQLWLNTQQAEVLSARRRYMSGPVGCGLCGIDSLNEALRDLPTVAQTRGLLTSFDVERATDQLRKQQPLHDQTRAVHAAGFLVSGKGIVMAREDVGRHNALDKLIGGLSRAGVDPAGGAFVITSRASVDMVQKTAMAGCPVLIAVSAPTALAVDVAEAAGVTLVAFARAQSFEIFSHSNRIKAGPKDVTR
jgi:FdhD protein